ncbi:MAG TPA: hypothetical protein VNW29_06315 [Candidatus Sulfotelmatobacter sp.]|jgi:hypothetical protein|nr:hypothetical protein [Candidatus Sulfotelmatobacter sp.]
MYTRLVIVKLVVFIAAFTSLFFAVRLSNILPQSQLNADLRSIPVLYGVGNFLFSIISGFVIQQQWRKWDILMDASSGEVSMLRQLYIVAHHFSVKERNMIRFHIYRYLDILIKSRKNKDLRFRSKKVDEALIRIEDTMFVVSKRYPDIGTFNFTYLTRAMEYREIKLQSSVHRLPLPIRVFLSFTTGAVIVGSLFLPFVNLIYNYYFTLVAASIAFGIILIVDDFDHPLQPGIYYLSVDTYRNLRNEIRNKLEYYAFDFVKAEAYELAKGHNA